MSQQLSSEQHAQIIILLDQDKSPSQVAEIFNIHRPSVIRVRQKFHKHNTYDHLGGNGRPKKLTCLVLSSISKEIKKWPNKSLKRLKIDVQNNLGINISVSSVKNALNSLKLFAFSPIKKPLLSKKILRLDLISQN